MKLSAKQKDSIIRFLGWLIMITCMLASMRHVAWMFSTLESGNLLAGWVSAFAFDTSICLLTLRSKKAKLEKDHITARKLNYGIRGTAVVTILANIVYMIVHQEMLIYTNRVHPVILLVIPYIFGCALPGLVAYLAEILSSETQKDIHKEAKAEKKAEKIQASLLSDTVRPDSELAEEIFSLVSKGTKSIRRIDDITGIGRFKTDKLLKQLVTQGRLQKDEKGQVYIPEADSYA